MDYIELRSFDNHPEADTVLKMLQHQNINCHLQAITCKDPLLNTALGGMKLMVHHTHVEKAWDLMEEAEQNYLKHIPCPVCHAHALKAISIMKDHKCKLSALASMLLNGHSVEVTKMYQCVKCGYDFKELP
jgi:hypothetical protein